MRREPRDSFTIAHKFIDLSNYQAEMNETAFTKSYDHFLLKNHDFSHVSTWGRNELKSMYLFEYLSSDAETLQFTSTHEYFKRVKFEEQSSSIHGVMVI